MMLQLSVFPILYLLFLLRNNMMSSFLVSVCQLISIFWLLTSADPIGSIPITKPGCKESCQNSTVKIPFPFGIGADCYSDPSYEIVCNASSSGAEIPILNLFDVEVLSLSTCSSRDCDISNLKIEVATQWRTICASQKIVIDDLEGSPFRISTLGNQLMIKGCPGVPILMNRKGQTLGGCSTVCQGGNNTTKQEIKHINISTSSCDGVGCCLISVDQKFLGVDFYQIALRSSYINTSQICMEFSLMEKFSDPKEKAVASERVVTDDQVPTVWYWMPPALQEDNFTGNYQKGTDFSCKPFCGYYDEAQCIQICTCNDGFEGNPYISDGCQDPCKLGTDYSSLNCKKKSLATSATILGLSIGLGSSTLILCCYGFYQLVRRWISKKKRANFFERNGGLLLQQQLVSKGAVVQRTLIFTAGELEKATDNFSSSRILGYGGQGTVYKGMLLDGRVVAIKKAKKVDKNHSKHFINEVVILSQINHRNVVKLLGCCLETQVPLLVYEYVPNGTLAKHIHSTHEDFQITWKMRLQIAAEIAGALAYLHSSSATPIYHRDIKSTNILLDEKYRAKLSDFGTSRTMMIDQTHLTTRVHGTFGYMDPEYFQSNQFTEKSDVYSFGVVLVELMTGLKPVSKADSGEWVGLAKEFLYHFETGRLHDIINAMVLEEAREEQLIVIAELAKRCLNLNGKERPTMKEVASALDGIRSSNMPPLVQHNFKGGSGDVIMKLGKINDEYVHSTTYFSANTIIPSTSLEIQPLMHNSI